MGPGESLQGILVLRHIARSDFATSSQGQPPVLQISTSHDPQVHSILDLAIASRLKYYTSEEEEEAVHGWEGGGGGGGGGGGQVDSFQISY